MFEILNVLLVVAVVVFGVTFVVFCRQLWVLSYSAGRTFVSIDHSDIRESAAVSSRGTSAIPEVVGIMIHHCGSACHSGGGQDHGVHPKPPRFSESGVNQKLGIEGTKQDHPPPNLVSDHPPSDHIHGVTS